MEDFCYHIWLGFPWKIQLQVQVETLILKYNPGWTGARGIFDQTLCGNAGIETQKNINVLGCAGIKRWFSEINHRKGLSL